MSNTFVRQRLAVTRVPLNGPKGQEWHGVLGGAQDQEMALLRTAGVATSLVKGPNDALDDAGSYYSLPRSLRETNDSYRARLAQAWPFWEASPTTGGIGGLFEVFGRAAIVVQSAVSPDWFSACSIVWQANDLSSGAGNIIADTGWGEQDFDGNDSLWGDGGLWGIAWGGSSRDPYFGIVDLDWTKRMVRAAKGAQAYPTVLYLGLAIDAHGSSAMWGDGGLWGDGGNWGDPSASTVIPIILGHTWGEEQRVFGVGGPGLWGTPGDVWDTFEPPSGGW